MVGSRLRDVRKDHHDTQESLAEKLGFSVHTVRKWESEMAEPNHETLKQICLMYNVTSDFLLGLTRDDPMFTKKHRQSLSDKSMEILHAFEDFLIERDKGAKNDRRSDN